jgi:hypothetical protein
MRGVWRCLAEPAAPAACPLHQPDALARDGEQVSLANASGSCRDKSPRLKAGGVAEFRGERLTEARGAEQVRTRL